MPKKLANIKALLDTEVSKRNSSFELSSQASPDPLQVASQNPDEYKALICALYSYGNAKAIVSFLKGLDFSLLDTNEKVIRQGVSGKVYRFQNSEDVIQSFITVYRAKNEGSLNEFFLEGYQYSHEVMVGLQCLIEKLYALNPYRSYGYTFWLGKTFTCKPVSTYKRWHMYLRWMVRNDALDLGLWQGVDKKDLLIPLDTHTHKVALKLGLIKRKSYDFKAVMELTDTLKCFDPNDPIKYDFSLYRLGQEKKL